MKFEMLIERRIPKFRFLYLVTGVCLIFLGWMKSYMGAQMILWPIAVLCFSLMSYSTLLTWMMSVVIFMTGSVHYSILLIEELIWMRSEVKVAHILRDAPIAFPSFVVFIIFVTIGIIMAKPKTIQHA
ncbi:MAG: hypothetical protein COA92_05270 [Sulfurovum sp.]|nr:MAG: hypothetical protein COA92_05250 [Sulfurovum sp.]PHS33301.1 MAG: hypothetical protein COA92_05270 [Sulfurovum sp.]